MQVFCQTQLFIYLFFIFISESFPKYNAIVQLLKF